MAAARPSASPAATGQPLARYGPAGQRQAKAHQPQNGQVVPADGERQRDHRRRGDKQGPPGGTPHARDPQRRPERDHERDAEPDPRIGEQPPGERARHSKGDQRRQVRVVGQPAVRGRERGWAGIWRPRVHKHLGRTDDDVHLWLRQAGRSHPGERGEQGTRQADQGGGCGAAAAGRHGDHGGDGVADDGQFAPQPFWGIEADQRRDDGKDRGQDEQGGHPFSPDHGECRGGEVPAR